MFINPDDRRVGNRRQQLTRAQIESLIERERRRRRSISSTSQFDAQERAPRARRSPFRGASAAGAMFGASRRGGGRAQFLSARVPGRPGARQYIEPPVVAPPRIQPPQSPRPLDQLTGGTETLQPFGLDLLRDQLGVQTLQPLSNPIRDSLLSGGVQSALSLPNREELFAPQTMSSHGLDLSQLAGLVPLGGGTWYDPATGTLRGAGGGGFRAI